MISIYLFIWLSLILCVPKCMLLFSSFSRIACYLQNFATKGSNKFKTFSAPGTSDFASNWNKYKIMCQMFIFLCFVYRHSLGRGCASAAGRGCASAASAMCSMYKSANVFARVTSQIKHLFFSHIIITILLLLYHYIIHHHHLFLKRPFFHAKLGLDVCPKSSPSTYP